MTDDLEVDYLIVGAGGAGMAFADTLLTETGATMAIVDERDRPGGHWTVAYPFVRLHQPSAFYGVASRELSGGGRDRTGGNAGLHELASAAEILSYYDAVLRTTFLPSGRVCFRPRARYLGADPAAPGRHRVRLLETDQELIFVVRRRVVDTTHLNVVVPAMRPPAYDVDPDVVIITPNALPEFAAGRTGATPGPHAVIGAGKTGIDACLWLLEHDVDPDAITWVVPRDPWVLDRTHLQPGVEFDAVKKQAVTDRVRAVLETGSVEDLFERLHGAGLLLRLFADGTPSAYRCATVTRAEIDRLRRITRIVRHGRVRRCTRDALVLDEATIPLDPATVLVDCTTDGLPRRPTTPIYDRDRIVAQPVIPCQQVASAALIAHVEAAYPDDGHRNHLCPPSPYPHSARDWIEMQLTADELLLRWHEDPELFAWLRNCRLAGIATGPTELTPDEARALPGFLRLEQQRLRTLLPS